MPNQQQPNGPAPDRNTPDFDRAKLTPDQQNQVRGGTNNTADNIIIDDIMDN